MKLDDILTMTFKVVEKVKESEFDFLSDRGFMEYLDRKYPAIKQFVTKEVQEIKVITDGIAAINVDMITGKPVLFINRVASNFILKECVKKLPLQDCYDAFACILWHESLHYIFRHFRMPFEGYDHSMMNIAMDMIIDNHIHTTVPGWRNWEEYLKAVNKQSPAKNMPLISMDPEKNNSIMTYGDKRLYFQLKETAIKIPNIRFDKHEWGGEVVHTDQDKKPNKGKQGEKQAGDKTDKDADNETGAEIDKDDDKDKSIWKKILDSLFNKSKERQDNNSVNPFGGFGTGDDKIIIELKASMNYDVLEILKKYINNVNVDSKRNTWKRTSRKLPGKRPGVVYKNRPGEIFLAFDTSGSMSDFNANKLPELLSGMLSAFKRVAKIVGSPAGLFAASIDTRVQAPIEIKNINDLKKILIQGGGGTDYLPVFDEVIMNWRKFAKSKKKVPDLIIFVTDFGVNLEFLKEKKYKVLGKKLIWLTTEDNYVKPPIGIVRRAVPKYNLP